MAYTDFTNLPRRTVSDKVLCDKVFNIAKNLKYHGYQCRLVSMFCKLLYEKSAATRANKPAGGAVREINLLLKMNLF